MVALRETDSPEIFDGDMLFNPPIWSKLVVSQGDLFSLQALQKISDRLRHEFHHGHQPNRQMPEIAIQDWRTPLLQPYAAVPIGYDLPCLISAERPTRGRIMFCAQDPLRGPGSPTLTVGTFFGIDSHYHRTRRHWGMMWRLIRFCVLSGYDVWVTDAIKLYAGKNVVARDTNLRELCYATVRQEVSEFEPDKIIAFGAIAEFALSAASINAPVIRAQHPTARGIKATLDQRFDAYCDLILN